MDITNILDNEYTKFKKKIKKIKKPQSSSSCMNGQSSDDDICMIGPNIIACNNFNYDDYIQLSNESNIIRYIPDQLQEHNYNNLYMNKTFNDNKSCKFRGTNQHFYINKLGYPNIGIDSDGYCILSGTHIG